MLGPQDVGHRVVVRRIVDVYDNRPIFSDALGHLVAIDETDLTMDTGTHLLRIPLRRVARAKRVPPRTARQPAPGTAPPAAGTPTPSGPPPGEPPPTAPDPGAARAPAPATVLPTGPDGGTVPAPGAGIAGLEWAAARAWPAARQQRMGGWLLRAAGGWTMRANAALPLGDPGQPLPAAVQTTIRWYESQGLPPRIAVPRPAPVPAGAGLPPRRRALDVAVDPGLDQLLDALDWQRGPLVLVQIGDLRPLATAPGRPEGVRPAGDVHLDPVPPADWLAMAAAGRGDIPPAGVRVLTGPEQVRFATVRDGDGRPEAIGRGAITDARLHLSLIRSAPSARRQGLARHVVYALATWAFRAGVSTGYLQVQQSDSAAVSFCRDLGFRTHHTYVTRTAPR